MTNIMTYYSYKKYYKGEFITVSNWNKLHGKQVKRKEIVKYLESFFGKIGKKPKECKKKIAQNVLVITKNGVIKQFRLTPISKLDIIRYNEPFTNKKYSISNDNKSLTNLDHIHMIDLSPHAMFKQELEKLGNPCAWVYDATWNRGETKEIVMFAKNPNSKYKPNKQNLVKAKTYLREVENHKKELIHNYRHNLTENSAFYKKYLDVRPEIAWLMCDNKYHTLNYKYRIFTFESNCEAEKYIRESIKNQKKTTNKESAFYCKEV